MFAIIGVFTRARAAKTFEITLCTLNKAVRISCLIGGPISNCSRLMCPFDPQGRWHDNTFTGRQLNSFLQLSNARMLVQYSRDFPPPSRHDAGSSKPQKPRRQILPNPCSSAHASQVPSFTPSIGQSFASMVVPTTDLVRLTFLTELLVGMKR